MTSKFLRSASMVGALACAALFGTAAANATGTHDHHKMDHTQHQKQNSSGQKAARHGDKNAMHTMHAKMMAMHKMSNDKVHQAHMKMMMKQHGGMKGMQHSADHHAQMQKMMMAMHAKHHTGQRPGMAMKQQAGMSMHAMKMPAAKASAKMVMAAGKTCGEFMYMKAGQCRDARLPKS